MPLRKVRPVHPQVGLQSPIYLDLRQLISSPGLWHSVAAAYGELRRAWSSTVAALPYAALPSRGRQPPRRLADDLPRREAKSYGTGVEIEGQFVPVKPLCPRRPGNDAEAKFEAIEKIAAAGLRVRDVVVLIDRGLGRP